MNAVKVKTSALIEVLKKNREKHREIFLEAQEGYRKLAISELEAMLAEARDGKKIRRMISLIEPMDQTRDYDRVIRMLEMSEDPIIELEEHDFKCYVLDDWQWKKQFSISNSAYSLKAADLATSMDAE